MRATAPTLSDRETHPPSLEATRRRLSKRQAEVVMQLCRATEEEVEAVGYTGLTVLSANPEVKHLRDRIGARTHRRLAQALGPGVGPMVVRVLETTYSGALLTAGIGHMSFLDIPDFVAEAARLMVGGPMAGVAPSDASAQALTEMGR